MPTPQEKITLVGWASCPSKLFLQELLCQAPKHYSKTLESIGEIDYNPVPPKRSERVIMRAQFKGRKKPRPYIFDEERL